MAGIGRTHLSAIERGQRKPMPETFFKLAEAWKFPPAELMKRIENAIH